MFLCTKEAKFSFLQLQNMPGFLHRTVIIFLYNFFEQVPDRMTVQWFYLRREKDHADLRSPKLIIWLGHVTGSYSCRIFVAIFIVRMKY